MNNIESALRQIPVSELSYSEWIQVGMALQTEGYDCAVWDEWSRNDSRYREGDCAKKWKTFQGASNPVTGATVVQMAKRYGWSMPVSAPLDWNDVIQADDQGIVPEHHPGTDLMRYLQTLFKPTEYVGYVTNDVWTDKDGKTVPAKGMYTRTAGDLIAGLRKHGDDLGAVVGDWNENAGAWIRFNALDGKGVKNENVRSFRFGLVESDKMSLSEQEALYRKLELPIACMVHSGGKSIHAIVRIDAKDADEYRQRMDFLYEFLGRHGCVVDTQNRNPSRLSRMPGVTRNGVEQRLLAVNIGQPSWDAWAEFAENLTDDLPDDREFTGTAEPMPLAPALIEGILRCGHKMLISGASKAGKSFLLLELALSLATGTKWCGFQCRRSKVLYVNLEIDDASLDNRLHNIHDALHLPPIQGLTVWTLRGKAVPMDKLVPRILQRYRNRNYDAIILDPIYKVITGDENTASEMAYFTNQFDKLCDALGCAVIYCHHHSKGSQGMKKSQDRASGSGVFARDADALLDLIELPLTDDIINNVCDGSETGWRLSGTLREFAPFQPVNLWFDYPIHRLDETGELAKLHPEGSAESNLSKSSKRTSADTRRSDLDKAFDGCCVNGAARLKDMAEYLQKNERTLRRHIVEEFADDYTLQNGIVIRTDTQN